MEVVQDVKSFVKRNGGQLQKFFIYKTGIIDRELIHEHIQEFYLKLIKTKALEQYREEKGSFDSYILNLFCWLMPQMAKKNHSVHHSFISCVQDKRRGASEAEDIWDHLSNSEGPYKIDFSPCTPRILDDGEEDLFLRYLEDFKAYISKTENDLNVHQMLTLLDKKQAGCKSTDIALILGVSDNMVKIIKQKLHRKFEIWKMLS